MADPCAPYVDTNGCVVVPACPAEPGAPAHVESVPVYGWNAGANSIDELDGDVFAQFDMPSFVAGVYIGFKWAGDRSRQTLPVFITHGFFFDQGLRDQYHIVESGAAVYGPVSRAPGDVFEIRRIAGVVTYFVNGALVHESAVRSSGPVIVNTCLYSSGDSVPSGATPTDALAEIYQPQYQGTLADSTPVAVGTNPDNPIGAKDWYWMYSPPAGAESFTVTLTDDAGNDFSNAKGVLIVGPLPASNFTINAQASANNSPFNAYVNSISVSTYYVLLHCTAGISGLTLEAVATMPAGGGGDSTLQPGDDYLLADGNTYDYVPTQGGSGQCLNVWPSQFSPTPTEMIIYVTDTADGEIYNNEGNVYLLDPDSNQYVPTTYTDGNGRTVYEIDVTDTTAMAESGPWQLFIETTPAGTEPVALTNSITLPGGP